MRLLGVAFWIAFVLALVVGGILVTRACGTGWPILNFCAPQSGIASDLAARHDALVAERDVRLAAIARAPQCRPPAREARASCLPPPVDETLVLVDVSSSMGWDYVVDDSLRDAIADLEARIPSMHPFELLAAEAELSRLYNRADSPRGPDRIDVARDALRPLASGLAPGASLKLMSFAECGAGLRQEGVYSAAEAGDYDRAVDGLSLRNATALAEALDALPRQTDAGRDADRPVGIVILSDGKDSCRGDPCAGAARLRERMPHAHVSVVSLAYGDDVNACIADATQGRFFRAGDTEELLLRLRQTAGQLSEEECAVLDGPANGETP